MSLQYWIENTECVCDSEHPIGGCLHCDLLLLRDAVSALQYMVEVVPSPPEKNCSCHIAPPCSDCVENEPLRDALAEATKALKRLED